MKKSSCGFCNTYLDLNLGCSLRLFTVLSQQSRFRHQLRTSLNALVHYTLNTEINLSARAVVRSCSTSSAATKAEANVADNDR